MGTLTTPSLQLQGPVSLARVSFFYIRGTLSQLRASARVPVSWNAFKQLHSNPLRPWVHWLHPHCSYKGPVSLARVRFFYIRRIQGYPGASASVPVSWNAYSLLHKNPLSPWVHWLHPHCSCKGPVHLVRVRFLYIWGTLSCPWASASVPVRWS